MPPTGFFHATKKVYMRWARQSMLSDKSLFATQSMDSKGGKSLGCKHKSPLLIVFVNVTEMQSKPGQARSNDGWQERVYISSSSLSSSTEKDH
jgi:hypothetical protein